MIWENQWEKDSFWKKDVNIIWHLGEFHQIFRDIKKIEFARIRRINDLKSSRLKVTRKFEKESNIKCKIQGNSFKLANENSEENCIKDSFCSKDSMYRMKPIFSTTSISVLGFIFESNKEAIKLFSNGSFRQDSFKEFATAEL